MVLSGMVLAGFVLSSMVLSGMALSGMVLSGMALSGMAMSGMALSGMALSGMVLSGMVERSLTGLSVILAMISSLSDCTSIIHPIKLLPDSNAGNSSVRWTDDARDHSGQVLKSPSFQVLNQPTNLPSLRFTRGLGTRTRLQMIFLWEYVLAHVFTRDL